ncbi:MAG TPA: glycosyltransferase family 1 protein [Terriglobales bacterium]|nr:glycosyltransferase family 1 protein [Terriglobales bacterium]
MINFFINALAASAGGGLTYLKGIIPCLDDRRDVRTTVLVPSRLARVFNGQYETVRLITHEAGSSAGRRMWWEQTQLRNVLRQYGANLLLSTGNFALRNSPIPQILLSRNALYTCPYFYDDLLARGEYRFWLSARAQRWLALRSLRWADSTIAPTGAFARELAACTETHVAVVPHGFHLGEFFREDIPCPDELQHKLQVRDGTLRLLFVSHYNYYRNFETLFRALPLVKAKLGRKIKLFLTCGLRPDANPGNYRPEAAAGLINDLGLRDEVVELGSVPYECLNHLYRSCDLYVTAAYAESFGHPLVEAMASGLPIIASDLPVHQEICGHAAVYFPKFSPEELANTISKLAEEPSRMQEMAECGRERARAFSWKAHVEGVLKIAESLVASSVTGIGHQPLTSATTPSLGV